MGNTVNVVLLNVASVVQIHLFQLSSINVQVQSAVKVGEESEVATNIQLYEI